MHGKCCIKRISICKIISTEDYAFFKSNRHYFGINQNYSCPPPPKSFQFSYHAMSAYNDKKRSLGSGETGRNHIWWRGIPGEENVVKLDSTNYDRIMSQTDKPALIMFYAQWCGYSVSARRGFAAAAHQLEQEGAHVMFGAVDCDQCEQIRDRYREIVGFPSFVYFVKGAPRINYSSQRSQEGFYNWIRKMQAVPQ